MIDFFFARALGGERGALASALSIARRGDEK
jgi:hypothetical protein